MVSCIFYALEHTLSKYLLTVTGKLCDVLYVFLISIYIFECFSILKQEIVYAYITDGPLLQFSFAIFFELTRYKLGEDDKTSLPFFS